MYNKNALILFASNGNNIGKTTTSKKFTEFLSNNIDTENHLTQVKSFANPIREISKTYFNILFSNPMGITFEDLYKRDNKNKPLKEFFPEEYFKIYPQYEEYNIRDIVNLFSDQIQLLSSPYVWANYALKDINNLIDISCSNNVIIYDDFRRPLEYTYLKENLENVKILTIYLDKKDVTNQVNTTYEGNLSDFPFDIKFTFNNDYSNLNELFFTIKDLLH